MPLSLLLVVNSLFQICYDKLGASRANTACWQLVNRFVTICLQTCNNLCVFTRVYDSACTKNNREKLWNRSDKIKAENESSKLYARMCCVNMRMKIQMHKEKARFSRNPLSLWNRVKHYVHFVERIWRHPKGEPSSYPSQTVSDPLNKQVSVIDNRQWSQETNPFCFQRLRRRCSAGIAANRRHNVELSDSLSRTVAYVAKTPLPKICDVPDVKTRV